MTKKTTITGHNHAPVGLAGSDNLLTVAAHATVTVSGQQDDAIFTDEGTSDNDILVNGTVTAQKLGSGVALLSDHSSILVGSHGDVSGFNGIASLGNDVTIDNFGTIHTYGSPSADGVAIGSDENNLSSGVLFHNRGTISGLVGVLFYASGSTITNEADSVISGRATGIAVTGNDVKIINHGRISGYFADAGIIGSDDGMRVVNDGIIKGPIRLGMGDDFFDNRGGTLKAGGVGGGALAATS